jgi:hypothetical protein
MFQLTKLELQFGHLSSTESLLGITANSVEHDGHVAKTSPSFS